MASSAGRGLLLALLLSSSVARAQQPTPTASERETARSLMSDGRDQRDRNDLRGALASFKAADALMHVPTTSLEVARTQVALGLLVEARDTLSQLLRGTSRADDPRPFVEARASAVALDDDLATRIPSIKLVLGRAPPDPRVAIDGVAIPAGAATAPIKVNPGHHVVTAADHLRAEVDVPEHQTKSITLAFPAQPVQAATDEVSGPAQTAQEASAPDAPHQPARTIALAGFGLGAIGVAVGTVSGILAVEKANAVKSTCTSNVCPPSSAGALDAAKSSATISTVAFIAGGVGLGVGLVALLVSHSSHADAAVARVVPWVGVGSAGVRGTF